MYATLQQGDDSVLERYIDLNPCKHVRSLKVNDKIVRYLSDEEKLRRLKAAKNMGGKFYLKVLMALATGMRTVKGVNASANLYSPIETAELNAL